MATFPPIQWRFSRSLLSEQASDEDRFVSKLGFIQHLLTQVNGYLAAASSGEGGANPPLCAFTACTTAAFGTPILEMHLGLLVVPFVLVLLASANTFDDASEQDPISYNIRAHWMRQAIAALPALTGSPCPSEAFGAVIVNHAASPEGELVCMGANSIKKDGNPTLHGTASLLASFCWPVWMMSAVIL